MSMDVIQGRTCAGARANLVAAVLAVSSATAGAYVPVGSEGLASPAGVGTNSQAVIATDGLGVSVVAFIEGSGVGNALRARFVGTDGMSYGALRTIRSDASVEVSEPALGISRSYRYHALAWTEDGSDGSGKGVFMEGFRSDGTALFPRIQVNSTSTGDQQFPALAMNGYSQYTVVAWSGALAGGGHGVFAQGFAYGLPVGPEVRVDVADSPAPLHPAVAIDLNGNYLVSWAGPATSGGPTGILARGFLREGAPTGGVMRIDSGVGSALGPVASASAIQTQRVVAWQRDGGIFARRIDQDGQVVGTEIDVSAVDGTLRGSPRVAVDDHQGFAVAWEDATADGDGYAIVARQFLADGSPIGVATVLNQSIAGDQRPGGIGIGDPGSLVALWSSDDAVTGTREFRTRRLQGVGSVDLSMFMYSPGYYPGQIGHGDALSLTIDVVDDATHPSLGSLAAATRLSLALPAGLSNLSVSGWDCTGTQVLQCLPPATVTEYPLPSLSLTATAPVASVDLAFEATLEGGDPDPNATNNGANLTLEVRDNRPDAIQFVDQFDVTPNTWVVSAPITVTGIDTPVSITVSGGEYSIDGGAYTNYAYNQVSAGQQVRVRHVSGSGFGSRADTTLTLADSVSDVFSSTTLAADTTPDAYAFIDVAGVALSTAQASNAIVVAGINAPAAISVTGGNYSIDGGAYTSVTGTVSNGQSVRVQHTSSSNHATATNTTLTIGGVSDTYTSTTLAADTTPNAYAFVDSSGVARSSLVTSNPVTVSGINAPAPISVTGGSYSINGGAFTSAAGTVTNGQGVRVQHVASASFSTATNTTLSIGGVSDTYTSTTEAIDTVPTAFVFTDATGVATGTVQTSDAVTVAGINAPAALSVANGSYSVNGGAYTSAAGSVVAGDSVRVRHTSAAGANTIVSTVLTIGGVSDTYASTTGSVDTTPNAFAFTDVTGARRNSRTTSNTITVSGINAGVAITVSGGDAQYSRNGGAYTASAGTVNNGDTVAVRVTSATTTNTTRSVVVTIGGLADTWTVTTGNK